MFGSEIKMLLDTVQRWTLEQLETQIENAKRDVEGAKRKLASVTRQKRLVIKMLSQYKKSQEAQKKRVAEFDKKNRAAMRKMPKFPAGGFVGLPTLSTIVVPPGKKKG